MYSATGKPEPNLLWFEKYIFLISYCPTIAEVAPDFGKASLVLDDLEAWHGHYDPPLAGRLHTFKANLGSIRALTHDRVIRMWRYHLLAAEITVAKGLLTIHQLQLGKRRDAVPNTQEYL